MWKNVRHRDSALVTYKGKIMKLSTIFNCSNDMALAANVRQYFPPKRIQQMEDDLKELALYWDEGPWGWSHCTKLRYKKMGISEEDLPSDEWLDIVRNLSSREYACNYIKQMLGKINDDRLVGKEMKFTNTINLSSLKPDENLIFKSPWSSSGRGVFTSHNLTEEQIEKKLQGFLNTQGGYVCDRFYDKETDFAMEFYVHENHSVDFLGYSVFQAAGNGAYGYNYVESQEELKARIGVEDELLEKLISYHKQHLGQTAYHGAIGIDMLKCKDGKMHPTIEINMRMNMGILAILLYNRYGANANVQLTQHREHGFEAVIDNGKLMIKYTK